MPENETVSPEIARAAISVDHLDLATAVVDEIIRADGAWSRETMTHRVAGCIKIASDRAADEARNEYAAKCLVCSGACLPGDSFDTDACETEHYTRIANDRALDARTTAFMDARQMGEVAA